MNKRPTLYTNEDQEIQLPFKWEICSHCSGHGKTSQHVECDGGGFTSSEWADQDDDFRRDYIAGVYDRECDHCEGGKVAVVDWPKLTKEQKREWNEQVRDDREMRSIERMERLMGC